MFVHDTHCRNVDMKHNTNSMVCRNLKCQHFGLVTGISQHKQALPEHMANWPPTAAMRTQHVNLLEDVHILPLWV